MFASLGPYGEPGLDFLDFLSEAGRGEVRLFFADRPQARKKFRAYAAEQFGRLSVAAGWLEHWGRRGGSRRRAQPGGGRVAGPVLAGRHA